MNTLDSVTLTNEQATLDWGHHLASRFSQGGLVFLNGDLGAGKTTLCKGILTGLNHQGSVKSPTYSIMEVYELNSINVFHFDLYRLADPEELEFIGGRDYFDNCINNNRLCLVEWSERAIHWLPEPQWIIDIKPLIPHQSGRQAHLYSPLLTS